jgi:hypothetical protein
MTTRPAYFVVTRDYFGRETPALYWDELPERGIRRLVYLQRLDLLPNAAALCGASLDQLFTVYQFLQKRGKLPPRWEPPPRPQAERPAVKTGYREVHARRHLPDAPYE